MKSYLLSLAMVDPMGGFSLHAEPSLEELGVHVFSKAHSQSEQLIAQLQQTIQQRELSLAGLSRIILADGPGSFTGLRIAFATCKALAMAREIPIETIHSAKPRAFRYLQENLVDEFGVVTQMTNSKWVISTFVNKQHKNDVVVGEAQLRKYTCPLVYDRKSAKYFDKKPVDLTSGDLARCTAVFDTKIADSIEKWITLSPNYFADERYLFASSRQPDGNT